MHFCCIFVKMKKFNFKKILQNNGWINNVEVITDEKGIIYSINISDKEESYNGYAIPGFQNAHSHAFQYAMAGIAENHNTNNIQDDFWSWRAAMYKLALSINPDQLETIASMLYSEMLRNGYTSVAEFHYLHHDKKGNKYNNVSEMSERLISAAINSGINITIVPVFYQMGGFGQEPFDNQKRFINKTTEDYLHLLENVEKACINCNNANIGIGVHSLRAVNSSDIIELSKINNNKLPFHLHISEQKKEIDDSISFLGKRPVSWLTDNIDLNSNYHLVHATHLDKYEINDISKSKANIVICPSTEGNLGDGIFPFKKFSSLNWSIGTDSHVGLNPMEEIRILDYGQRLTSNNRNTFANKNNGDSGLSALESTIINGRKAMGDYNSEFFKVGEKLNALVISDKHPLISSTRNENLLNTIIYSSDISMYKGTIANGNWKVQNGAIKNQKIYSDFYKVISELKNR